MPPSGFAGKNENTPASPQRSGGPAGEAGAERDRRNLQGPIPAVARDPHELRHVRERSSEVHGQHTSRGIGQAFLEQGGVEHAGLRPDVDEDRLAAELEHGAHR